jgi:4'-phosphopantetheinyl transferase
VAAAEPRILRPGQDDPRAAPGTLLPGEVEVWLFELSAERADRLATALAPDELEHRDRLRQPDARVRFADVRGCLRTILAGHLGVQPGEIAFRSGPHGKPALAERHGSDLEFSVSHSGQLAAIAVAAGEPVGIDVEQRRRHDQVERLADRILADSERARFAELASAARAAAFVDLWCMKEACSKLVGRGLGLPMTAIAIDDPVGAAVTAATVGEDATRALVRTLAAGDAYGGALALRASTERGRLTTL